MIWYPSFVIWQDGSGIRISHVSVFQDRREEQGRDRRLTILVPILVSHEDEQKHRTIDCEVYLGFRCRPVLRNRVFWSVKGKKTVFWLFCRIIMAMVTVLERITDVFLPWLGLFFIFWIDFDSMFVAIEFRVLLRRFPFYSEMKLAFVIYLWHTKTKVK